MKDFISNLVFIQNDQVLTDSLKVAEKFEKEHKNVIRDIDEIVAKLAARTASDKESSILSFQKMFQKDYYKVEEQNRKYPLYYMNEDGFTLLAMGFTGDKAFDFKVAFLTAFKMMAQKLHELDARKNDAGNFASSFDAQLIMKAAELTNDTTLLNAVVRTMVFVSTGKDIMQGIMQGYASSYRNFPPEQSEGWIKEKSAEALTQISKLVKSPEEKRILLREATILLSGKDLLGDN